MDLSRLSTSQLILIGLTILGLATVTSSVRITNLKVPSVYELSNANNPDKLVLDCEFEVKPEDIGFVLKWQLNQKVIYQWIPNRKPYAYPLLKNNIDLKYVASENLFDRYRALAFIKPSTDLSGDYTCAVNSFESEDRQTAHMQVLVPEQSFTLEYSITDEIVDISCVVKNVFPEPQLTLIINDDGAKTETASHSKQDEIDGLYDAEVFMRIEREALEDETAFTCWLNVNAANYTKKEEVLFNVNHGNHYQISPAMFLVCLIAFGFRSIA